MGTGDDVETLIRKKNPQADFDVVSLPEILREGFAVHEFFHPDRVVVGANTERAAEVIKRLYRALPEARRRAFEQTMAQRLQETGDQIRIYDTLDLYLARKP